VFSQGLLSYHYIFSYKQICIRYNKKISQSLRSAATGVQSTQQNQIGNHGSGSSLDQTASNNIANNNNNQIGNGITSSQIIFKNQQGSQDQAFTKLSDLSATQDGTNDATNSHTGGPASSTQTPIGTQTFGQNQNIANSNNTNVRETAKNEQQNIDTNTAAGTAPTIQSIFGDNQKLGQTQSVRNSGGSSTEDSVTNTTSRVNGIPMPKSMHAP
jgi:hypothetical protein